MTNRLPLAAVLLPAALALPAAAHAEDRLSVGVTTDYRERGLGWSDGEAAVVADGAVEVANGLSIEAKAATLRGSARHGGADGGLRVGPAFTGQSGGWALSGGVFAQLFAGAQGKMDYLFLDASAARTLGPAQLTVGLRHTPSQGAVGARTTAVDASLAVGVPGTPLTVSAGAGYSFGPDNADPRTARLRPGGDYADWRIGVEHLRGPLALGLAWTDTSIDGKRRASPYADRHDGSRIMAEARFAF